MKRALRFVGSLALAALAAACVGPIPPATPSPTPLPTPSPSGERLYLRAWTTQALPPEHTFRWPSTAIAQGIAIDGNVAVPAIFPGPLVILPNARSITPHGEEAIVALAGDLGLLSGKSDFTEAPAPGAPTAHLVIRLADGTHELQGSPGAFSRCVPDDVRCVPEPGSAEAFAFFWARLGELDRWIEAELGPLAPYRPERLAAVTRDPQPQDVPPGVSAWPLDVPFERFGEPWTMPGSRCATISDQDLNVALPVLLAATDITVFIDAQDEARTLLVRVLVPGEPSPCEP